MYSSSPLFLVLAPLVTVQAAFNISCCVAHGAPPVYEITGTSLAMPMCCRNNGGNYLINNKLVSTRPQASCLSIYHLRCVATLTLCIQCVINEEVAFKRCCNANKGSKTCNGKSGCYTGPNPDCS